MGWAEHRLDELFDIARGGSPRPIKQYLTTEEDGVNWIKISDATSSSKYIYETKERIKPEGVRRSRLVREGDFILSNSMSFGRPYIMRTSGCIHDGWVVLSPKTEMVDQEFLFHLLGSPVVYKQFDQLAAGSTVRNLNIGLVSSVRVPVPPLAEQKQIVTILDEAFADIDRARELAELNLNNIRELFDSTLNQIFTQHGEDWNRKTVGEVLELKYGKPLGKDKRKADGLYPAYGANGIKDRTDYSYCEKQSIIVGRKGSAGELTLTESKFWPLDVTYFVEFDDDIYDLHFLYYLLKMIDLPSYAVGVKPGINRNIVYALNVDVPTLDTQKELVESIEAMKASVENLENIYQQKITALDELKRSLLQKAFRGELTSKDVQAA